MYIVYLYIFISFELIVIERYVYIYSKNFVLSLRK